MIHLAIIFKAHHVNYCVKQHLEEEKHCIGRNKKTETKTKTKTKTKTNWALYILGPNLPFLANLAPANLLEDPFLTTKRSHPKAEDAGTEKLFQ